MYSCVFFCSPTYALNSIALLHNKVIFGGLHLANEEPYDGVLQTCSPCKFCLYTHLSQRPCLNVILFLGLSAVVCMFCFRRFAPMVIPLYSVYKRRVVVGMSLIDIFPGMLSILWITISNDNCFKTLFQALTSTFMFLSKVLWTAGFCTNSWQLWIVIIAFFIT